jgi:orotate phosphoribosyltransferase
VIDAVRRSGLLDDVEAARFVHRGHFVYEGGDHGDTRLALELLFADPRRLERAAGTLAERLREHGADLVCGPLVGGALLGQWIAHALGIRFVYTEPQAPGRYAVPAAVGARVDGRRVVVVDDVINAGSATVASAGAIEALGGRVVAVAALIVRDSTAPEIHRRLGAPVEALLTASWQTWRPDQCVLCATGVPLGASVDRRGRPKAERRDDAP